MHSMHMLSQFNAQRKMTSEFEPDLRGPKVLAELKSLCKVLRTDTVVTRLNLLATELGDKGLGHVADLVKHTTTLRNLCLTHNPAVTQDGVKSLAASLAKNHSLHDLLLSFNTGVGSNGIIYLANALLANTTLTRLCVHECRGDDRAAAAIGEMLKQNSTLRRLELSNNAITPLGAASLADGFALNRGLCSLDLSQCRIGDVGVRSLLAAFEKHACIESIRLAYVYVGDALGEHAASLILKSQSLRSLDLAANLIADVGGTALAVALESNSVLTHLCLSHNQISNVGASSFAAMLRTNRTLRALSLDCNRICPQCDDGLEQLHLALANNFTLTSMDIDGKMYCVHEALDCTPNRATLDKFDAIRERNLALLWKSAVFHRLIVDICFAMQSLNLPPYVLLEIIDWLPYMYLAPHHRKINLIFAVRNSCDRRLQSRNVMSNLNKGTSVTEGTNKKFLHVYLVSGGRFSVFFDRN